VTGTYSNQLNYHSGYPKVSLWTGCKYTQHFL
jgi:hypothetical protein